MSVAVSRRVRGSLSLGRAAAAGGAVPAAAGGPQRRRVVRSTARPLDRSGGRGGAGRAARRLPRRAGALRAAVAAGDAAAAGGQRCAPPRSSLVAAIKPLAALLAVASDAATHLVNRLFLPIAMAAATSRARERTAVKGRGYLARLLVIIFVASSLIRRHTSPAFRPYPIETPSSRHLDDRIHNTK